jgi:hypothetical protein
LVGSGYWETIQVFHDTLQAAIARVTRAILLLDGPFPPEEPIGRLRMSEVKAALGRPASNRALSLAMRFRVVTGTLGEDRWEIQTFAYSYLLFRDDREEVAYHWDDEAVAGVLTPHVHFGIDLAHTSLPREDRDRLGILAAAHLPTGLVPFTQILRAALRDLGVEPVHRQGESKEDARVAAERSFREAEAALISSFAWWKGRID